MKWFELPKKHWLSDQEGPQRWPHPLDSQGLHRTSLQWSVWLWVRCVTAPGFLLSQVWDLGVGLDYLRSVQTPYFQISVILYNMGERKRSWGVCPRHKQLLKKSGPHLRIVSPVCLQHSKELTSLTLRLDSYLRHSFHCYSKHNSNQYLSGIKGNMRKMIFLKDLWTLSTRPDEGYI